jgi:hypothetical protein
MTHSSIYVFKRPSSSAGCNNTWEDPARAVAPAMMRCRDRVVCDVFVSLCEDYTDFCVKTMYCCVKTIQIFIDLCLVV